jgi:hypothetical protein
MARGEVTRLGHGGFGHWQVACADCHASVASQKKAQAMAEREFVGTGWTQTDDEWWVCPRCSVKRKASDKADLPEAPEA